MARLQILELPTEHHGDDMVTPFVLVIDQYEPPPYPVDVNDPDPFVYLAEKIGARAVLAFEETIEIPANADAQDQPSPRVADFADLTEAKRLTEQRDEARSWARHGYEIGQKHCGWSDHGVAPDWLTEGWPPHIDSCEHLKQMAEFDEALTQVRGLPTEPEVMNSEQERPDIWLHGYKCGVAAAKSAARPRNEPTVKP